MISEHDFAEGYSSVWHRVTPLSDGYWKVENMLVMHELAPLPSRADKSMRGAVNESAFRAFCDLRMEKRSIDRGLVLAAVDAQAPAAVAYVGRLAPRSELELAAFDDACRREAALLALRLLHYFQGLLSIQLRPRFRGCGVISSCEGDLIQDDCLYEIKAGDRAFRITDLRQLLVYSALAYSAGALEFKRIGLFNPRTGTAWTRTLDQVCESLAGARAVDTLSTLVSHFSTASVSR